MGFCSGLLREVYQGIGKLVRCYSSCDFWKLVFGLRARIETSGVWMLLLF